MKTHVINWFSFSLLIWWELLNSWVFVYRDLSFVANSNPNFLLKTKITSAFKNVLKTQKLNNQNHRKSSSTRKGHCYKRALNVGGSFTYHTVHFLSGSPPHSLFFFFFVWDWTSKNKKRKSTLFPFAYCKEYDLTWNCSLTAWPRKKSSFSYYNFPVPPNDKEWYPKLNNREKNLRIKATIIIVYMGKPEFWRVSIVNLWQLRDFHVIKGTCKIWSNKIPLLVFGDYNIPKKEHKGSVK